MARKWTVWGALLVLVALGLGSQVRLSSPADPRFALDDPASPAALGIAAFGGESFGGLSTRALETHAVPWKLTAAALALRERQAHGAQTLEMASVDRALARFGFLTRSTPANLPDGVTYLSDSETPLGFTQATLAPLPGAIVSVANLGCAACHSGVVYDETGTPDPSRAWLGAPNTSLNLEAYVSELATASRLAAQDPDGWVDAAKVLFPEMGWREEQSLRWLVVPLAVERLARLGDGPALPFPNGYPGATNGVAALKHALDLPLMGGGPGDAGVVSVPDLGGRLWRSALLADGSYAPPDSERWKPVTAADRTEARRDALAAITSFFSVPSMGVNPDRALDYIPRSEEVFAWLDEAYTPQPFPGPIDQAGARRGSQVYAAQCASCHGTYRETASGPELVSFPNWAGDVGTDPLRAEAFTPDLVRAVNAGSYGDRIAAKATGLYAAPPLAGLWSSAPYLHNGAVPSVFALLTPEARPTTFLVGGHALDFTALGVRARTEPNRHEPHAGQVEIDTTQPGLGNAGHTFGTDLDAGAKTDLIEYLKQL